MVHADLTLWEVCKRYGSVYAVDALAFEIGAGEIFDAYKTRAPERLFGTRDRGGQDVGRGQVLLRRRASGGPWGAFEWEDCVNGTGALTGDRCAVERR